MICLVYNSIYSIIIRTMNNDTAPQTTTTRRDSFPGSNRIYFFFVTNTNRKYQYFFSYHIQMRFDYDITVFRRSRSLRDTIFEYINTVYV